MNSIYAMSQEEAEAERVRLQALAAQHLADNRAPLPESISVRDALIDAGIILGPDDDEIIQHNAETFGWDVRETVTRLSLIDFAAARRRYEVMA